MARLPHPSGCSFRPLPSHSLPCAAPYKPHVAESLKCGWSELGWAVTANYTTDFENFT